MHSYDVDLAAEVVEGIKPMHAGIYCKARLVIMQRLVYRRDMIQC